MRQRDPSTPEETRELDALERALAGEPVDADLRELEDLVRDIRATAPQMTPAFAARLEQQVAEGFPEPQEQPAPRPPRRWMLLPAAGSLAAVVAAVVVAAGSGDSPSQITTVSDGGAQVQEGHSAPGTAGHTAAAPPASAVRKPAPPATATRRSAPAPDPAAGGVSGSTSDPAGPGASAGGGGAAAQLVAPGTAPRRVQRSADLVLGVPAADLDATSDGVVRTVDRFGGIVASSAIGSDETTGEATFELRIPTGRLDDALAALSKLGHVAQRRQSLVDITSSFTSVQDRLSDARAERRGLLRALGGATTQRQVDSLRARLRDVRSQIARRSGDLDALRRRADLSSVSVTVRADGRRPGAGAGSGGSWSPSDAARDALRVLEVIAGGTLVALAVLAPLALLAALVALSVRSGRRRRREGALDTA
jgi:hypothetical protein